MATESELADVLKNQCYRNGKERNPKESAETIHKLGLLYRNKKPEKISLIQSAVLLNAAIVRQPDNVEVVQQDLKLLISDVLLRANAENKDADLLEFSVNIRNELHVFREKVKNDLALLKPPNESLLAEGKEIERNNKISQVMSIQNFVTEKYVSLMRKINDFCMDIMGQPPCRYALIGMGSIAHKEITPYSDFESAIVLEEGVDDEVIEYFRWCSVLFQLVLACLQETIIRFIAIESLNDPTRPGGDWFYDVVTPCGVCSDGFAPQASKHPLGRQKPTEKKSWITELIKPVSEMVKYLESDEDLKNGYHLADVLSKTCFVAGDSDIYEKFRIKSRAQLNINSKTYKKKLLEDMTDNLNNFDFMELLGKSFNHELDVKRALYRTSTIFVSGLGKYFDTSCTSNFEILDELSETRVISRSTSNRLKHAVAVSCEARLKTYMKTKEQSDKIKNDVFRENEVNEFVNALGRSCVLEYIETIFSFIKCLKRGLQEFKKNNGEVFSVDFDFNIGPLSYATACVALSMFNEAASILQNLLGRYSQIACDYEKPDELEAMELLARVLTYQERYGGARYFFEQTIKKKSRLLNGKRADDELLLLKTNLGQCLFVLSDISGALKVFREVLDCRLLAGVDSVSDEIVANCRHCIGRSALGLSNYGDAIEQFQLELSIRQAVIDDDSVFGPCCKMLKDGNQDIITCIYWLATSMVTSGQHRTALLYFLKALWICQRMSDDVAEQWLTADICYKISFCYYHSQQFALALDYAIKTFDAMKYSTYEIVGKDRKTLKQRRKTPLRILFAELGKKLREIGQLDDALISSDYELKLHKISNQL